MELGEIEHHLSTHHLIQHAVVIYPKTGRLQNRLVALISLRETFEPSTGDEVNIAVSMEKELVVARIKEITDTISQQLPIFMIPEMWVIIESIPLMSSRKINRNAITQWTNDMNEATYFQILDMAAGDILDAEASTPTEKSIQKIVSRVLGLPDKRVGMSRSFVSMGGDSISAMQVMSRCRVANIKVTVQDILRSKSITQLALHAKASVSRRALDKEEEVDTYFPLSPIQQMFFDQAFSENTSFNQSFAVRVRTPLKLEDLTRAFKILIRQHSMLRARFSMDRNGVWTQKITTDVDGSFQLLSFDLELPDQITHIATASQDAVDIEKGPILAINVFNVKKSGQYLFLTASHLVVDLVSWRVLIQDLEEILENGALKSFKPLPFLSWCQLQTEYSEQHLAPNLALPSFMNTPYNADYWGMSFQSNTYGDIINEAFTLTPEVTKSLLSDVHGALRTNFVDICISTMLHSFHQTFPDREVPSTFIESHGRESWDDEIDNSRTVGWFTTMYPVQVEIGAQQSLTETIRRTKDARRLVSQNGWPYFASRFLNSQGREKFREEGVAEIIFNYEGQYQEMQSDQSLLRMDTTLCKEAQEADIGQDIRRFALFEISVVIIDGKASFTFIYNLKMLNASGIRRWIASYQNLLREATLFMPTMEPEYTLSDFPLLSLTPSSLHTLLQGRLPTLGWSEKDLEDAYPCSPLQQGLLVSQAKSSGSYDIQFSWEILSPSRSADVTVDLDQLDLAWQKVIEQHSTLRTLFAESVTGNGIYDQIVLKKFRSSILQFGTKDYMDVDAFLSREVSLPQMNGKVRHQFSVWQDFAKTVCTLDISHALIDGGSIATLTRDLALAYDGKIINKSSRDPVFREFIGYIQSQNIQTGLEYWKTFLESAEACYMPQLLDELELSKHGKQLHTMTLTLTETADSINRFCGANDATVSNLVQAVWAVVLRSYVGTDSVCFGYLTSGRDAPVQGIEYAVGSFINMLVCYAQIDENTTIRTLMGKIMSDFSQALLYQYCSLADIQHSLGFSGQQALFNTGVSVQRSHFTDPPVDSSLEFRILDGQDATEVILRFSHAHIYKSLTYS